jgi:CheY-like chemotaxis protein
MPTDLIWSAKIIETLPLSVICLDTSGVITQLNKYARNHFHLACNDTLHSHIHPDSEQQFFEVMANPSTEIQIQLINASNSHWVQMSQQNTGNSTYVFMRDISEQLALSTQLRASKRPEKKMVHDLYNALTATMGYAELIGMMLEEHKVISGERLADIQRYQREVYIGLQKADLLLRNQKEGGIVNESGAVPIKRKHIMIVDDEPSITEFLSELMRAKQYKVTSFTDSTEALSYFTNHISEVDLVIMDQVMPQRSGLSLASELLSHNKSLPIVLCTGDHGPIDAQMEEKSKIKHFVRKPIDINELSDMVSEIID